MALEATRCGQGVERNGTAEQEQLRAQLIRVARRPELVTFLVMVPECAVVRVVHSPFEYRAPLDSESAEWDEEIFSFVGERVRGHLPTLVRASPRWFERRRVRPGRREELERYYSNPAVRRCLMPPADATGGHVSLPHMVHIPREWAVKVLARPRTPYEVYCWVRECVAAVPVQDRAAYTLLKEWCAASCVG